MRHHGYQDNMNAFEKLECVANLYNVRIVTIEDERGHYNHQTGSWVYHMPIERSHSYGDQHEVNDHTPIDPTKTYVMSDYTGGSDYSGDLVNVANYKALIQLFPSEWEDGFEYVTLSGDYNTFDVAIRIDALTTELIDALHSLSDYPCLDESLWSELEMESQNEAWESDIRSDFRTALGKRLYSVWDDSSKANQREDETDSAYQERIEATEEYLSEECGGISDSDLGNLFWRMSEIANVEWLNEEGPGSWIDVDEVISGSIGRNLNAPDTWKGSQEHYRQQFNELASMIQAAMSDTKYDLGILKFVDPNQYSLELN